MKQTILLLLLFLGVGNVARSQDVWVLDSTIVHVEITLDSSLIEAPWDLNWGPDDKLWFNDLEYVQTYDPITGDHDTILYRPGENALGLAIHDDVLGATPYVFVAYDTTAYYGGGQLVNLWRYEYSGGQLINPLLLISYEHAGEHAGGRIVITDDDKILITTADFWFGGDPLRGRTLRLNFDGTIPLDNPNPVAYEYTSGHRNPQGLVQIPNGNVFNSEHGQAGNDEVNLIQSGGHYGWPTYDGDGCTNIEPDSCTSMTYSYISPLNAVTAPPAGVDYYDHTAIPEFNNGLLVGTLWSSLSLDVHTLNTSGDSVINYRKYLNVNGYHRIRDVTVHPDGSIYFIGFDREAPTAIYHLYKPSQAKIADHVLFSSVSIFPNPTAGETTISWSSVDQPISISLLDINGKYLLTESVPTGSNQYVLTTDELANGIYIIELVSAGGQHIRQKLIAH